MSNILDNTTETDAAFAASVKPQFNVQKVDNGVTVQIDLPSVPSDNLEVTTEKQLIKIKARRTDSVPAEWSLLNNVTRPAAYALDLNLHRDLDPSTIKARFTNGVLLLHLSKRKETLPRKIDINTTE